MLVSIIEINLNLSRRENYIRKYNLEYIGKYKEYNILNTKIMRDGNSCQFYKIIYINDKEYKLEEIFQFSFYDVDNETIYDYYKKDNIILKSYPDYFDIELINK